MRKDGRLQDFLIQSGFASLLTTDSSGSIVSAQGLDCKTGTSIHEVFPDIDLSSTEVQQVSRTSDAAAEHFRVVVFSSSPDRTEILLQDITDHVKTSSTLEKAMHLQSRVMKAIPDIVVIKDRNGNWLGSNSAAEKLRNSIVPHDKEIPILAPNCVESDEEAWKSSSFYRQDEIIADGRVFDVTKNALRNSDGSPHCLIVLARDVTDSRKRERRILKLNQLIETLRRIDKLIINSVSQEALVTGVASILADSGIFKSFSARMFATSCTNAITATLPRDAKTSEDVFSRLKEYPWSGNSLTGAELAKVLPEVCCNHGDYIASRLYYGEKDFGVLVGRLSSDKEYPDIPVIEVISDISDDLSFALHGLEMKENQEKFAAEVLQTRNLLDSFMEHFPGPAFIRDGDSRYLKMNNRFRDVFQHSEWLGKAPEDIYPEDVAEDLHIRDREVIEKGYVNRVRHFVDKKGQRTALEVHYFRIDQEDGPLIGGVALDITERLNAQEGLVRSEEKYRAIYENTGTVMAILDPDGTVVSANDNAERLSGYSPEEITNKMKWTEFVHPEDLKTVAARRALRLEGKQDVRQEYQFRLRRKDGTFRNVRACTGTIPNSDGMGVLSISDITSLIDYQAKLNSSLNKTRTILTAIPDLMFVLSRTGEYLDFFARDEEILALPADEIPESSIFDIGLSPETSSRISCAIEEVIDTRTSQTVEYHLELPDGTHFYEAGMSPFESESVLVLCRDVTARKNAEEEQKKLEAQVRHVQKLESLGVLAGGIAHDFNNILMAITGNVYLAKRSLHNDQSPLEYLEAVDKAASRASDLAGQMLAYSGRGEVRIKPMNLNVVAEEISDILSATISKKALLSYRLDPDIPLILADNTQIRQVVMNLLTNASEALEQNTGTITVSTGSMYCDADYIRTLNRTEKLKPGRYVWIEVEDTGLGMKRDLFDRIFDPFFTTKFTGRGLGLSAVLGIMSSHGGALKIESEPGKGSTFRALFPASRKVQEDNVEPVRTDLNLVGAGTVLFVDDEPLIRSVAETMISAMGFNVVCASDGLEGLNRFKEYRDEIKLVILDLTMPNMDGDEVFREIRKLHSDIPILISSGYNENEMLTRFTDSVPDRFLKKPYSAAQLSGKIRSILSE